MILAINLLNDGINLIGDFLFPITVAILAYYFVSKWDERQKKKKISLLGSLIIDALLEEVRTGVSIYRRFNDLDPKNPGDISKAMIPKESWNGMQTISDDVLLRIIKVSDRKNPNSFPLNQIRSHCKNYFHHMRQNLINAYQSPNWIQSVHDLAKKDKHYEAAVNVEKMLEQAKEFLLKNSSRIFPK